MFFSHFRISYHRRMLSMVLNQNITKHSCLSLLSKRIDFIVSLRFHRITVSSRCHRIIEMSSYHRNVIASSRYHRIIEMSSYHRNVIVSSRYHRIIEMSSYHRIIEISSYHAQTELLTVLSIFQQTNHKTEFEIFKVTAVLLFKSKIFLLV